MTLFLTLFPAPIAIAKPRPTTHSYPSPCSRVWKAVKIALYAHYDILSLDEQDQSGSFTTGIAGAITGAPWIGFALTGSSDTCTVSVTNHSAIGRFSGPIHGDKGDIFKRIEEQLK
jgi:hypothetical protein